MGCDDLMEQGSLARVLDQRKDMDGRTGDISIRSDGWLTAVHWCRFLSCTNNRTDKVSCSYLVTVGEEIGDSLCCLCNFSVDPHLFQY